MEKYTWQLYNTQGMPVEAMDAPKLQAIIEGTLHGSTHVWIWRQHDGTIEILLQKRASDKINWPGMYDKSAGGHILYGEQPIEAAVRKAKAELGLRIKPEDLRFVGVHHWSAPIVETGLIENDFQWIYLLEDSEPQMRLPTQEVDAITWKRLNHIRDESRRKNSLCVPYGQTYFMMLADAVALAAR